MLTILVVSGLILPFTICSSQGQLVTWYFIDIIHGFLFCYLNILSVCVREFGNIQKLSHQCHLLVCCFSFSFLNNYLTISLLIDECTTISQTSIMVTNKYGIHSLSNFVFYFVLKFLSNFYPLFNSVFFLLFWILIYIFQLKFYYAYFMSSLNIIKTPFTK